MRAWLAGLTALTLSLTACGGDAASPTAAPTQPTAPDLDAKVFRLRLDTRTGEIQVIAPETGGRAADANGSRLKSAILDESVADVSASGLGCVPLPVNLKLKRCTFDLSIRNRLSATDLVTPTAFPAPPPGTEGILAFPWRTSIEGATGVAVPSPDWDGTPINFFNDFGACSNGGRSDCYRYETIPSPLYAGRSSYGHRVGYDVPAATTFITADVVVGADLRDNPVRTLELATEPELCGETYLGRVDLNSQYLRIGSPYEGEVPGVGFCSFSNRLPRDIEIRGATVRFFRYNTDTAVELEALRYGETLEASDIQLDADRNYGTMPQETAGINASDGQWVAENVTATVVDMAAIGYDHIQFRLTTPGPGFANFAGTGRGGILQPELIVRYTLR
jgi:hypothetical protein